MDLRSQAVWNGHPRHFVIDNSTCFEGKMERLQQKAAQLVGLPHVPSEPDRFWLKSVSARHHLSPEASLDARSTFRCS